MPHRRRCAGRGRAARRVDLVPGERASARQGELFVPGQRSARHRGDRQRRPSGRRATGRALDLALGGGGADGGLPLDGHDRAVRHLDAHGRRAPVRRRDRPGSPQAPEPRTGPPLRGHRHRPARLPAADADDRRAREAARNSPFYVHARHDGRAADFFFVEARTAGRRRLDDAARQERRHTSDATMFNCDGAAQAAPVPDALPALPAVADCLAARGPPAPGRRRPSRARGTSAGSSISRRWAGPQRRDRAQLHDRRPASVRRHRRRRRHGHGRSRRLDLLRGRRRHAGRLDRRGRAARQRAQRGRLDRRRTAARGPRKRRRRGEGRGRPREPEIVDFLAGVFGPYPFSASRLDRRRHRLDPRSRSRTRRARSTRGSSSRIAATPRPTP